jgi:hypothetical protein
MNEEALNWMMEDPIRTLNQYNEMVDLRNKTHPYVTVDNEEPSIPKSKVFSKKTIGFFAGITLLGVAYLIMNFIQNYHPIY